MSEDDGAEFQCHDNANLEPEEDPETALRSFRESLHWGDDMEDSKHLSTNEEEE